MRERYYEDPGATKIVHYEVPVEVQREFEEREARALELLQRP
jgi:hypothetical protein